MESFFLHSAHKGRYDITIMVVVSATYQTLSSSCTCPLVYHRKTRRCTSRFRSMCTQITFSELSGAIDMATLMEFRIHFNAHFSPLCEKFEEDDSIQRVALDYDLYTYKTLAESSDRISVVFAKVCVETRQKKRKLGSTCTFGEPSYLANLLAAASKTSCDQSLLANLLAFASWRRRLIRNTFQSYEQDLRKGALDDIWDYDFHCKRNDEPAKIDL
eukprot:6180082-Pleurochrysis_carterae.AAC.3